MNHMGGVIVRRRAAQVRWDLLLRLNSLDCFTISEATRQNMKEKERRPKLEKKGRAAALGAEGGALIWARGARRDADASGL